MRKTFHVQRMKFVFLTTDLIKKVIFVGAKVSEFVEKKVNLDIVV